MLARDKHIASRHALVAGVFRAAYAAGQRVMLQSPKFEFASKSIAPPTRTSVPTRHGPVNVLIFAPVEADIAAQAARGERPPVHLLMHGGGFIAGHPREEGNVARYLASEVGCYIVAPDYARAPQVRHPVAEQQCFDVFDWILASSAQRGWDGERISVGGASAGGMLALGIALTAIDSGGHVPVAVTHEYSATDMSRSDKLRTSPLRMPAISAPLMRLIRNTYFNDVDLTDPLVSPMMHPLLDQLPPTLVLTGELDTVCHESNEFAEKLRGLGVDVTHREFAGVDHAFTHWKPVETAREAITMIGDHLGAAYRRALPTADHVTQD